MIKASTDPLQYIDLDFQLSPLICASLPTMCTMPLLAHHWYATCIMQAISIDIFQSFNAPIYIFLPVHPPEIP